jgi:hypothetical protein
VRVVCHEPIVSHVMQGVESSRQTEAVPGHTVVATANVQETLGRDDARAALDGVLELAPDLVGLQEWNLSRHRLLRETGSVRLVPGIGPTIGRRTSGGIPWYLWSTPIVGGCAVGARADRFKLISCSYRVLSRPGWADRRQGWLELEAPRIATVAVYRELDRDRTVCLLNYHLVYGAQSEGRYREDRPVLVDRHRAEIRRVQRVVDEQLARGCVVHAVGDSNFDGLRLSGLTSAWEGREGEPGTLGAQRKVDDVLGPGRATSVTLIDNASDHRAVIVTRSDR